MSASSLQIARHPSCLQGINISQKKESAYPPKMEEHPHPKFSAPALPRSRSCQLPVRRSAPDCSSSGGTKSESRVPLRLRVPPEDPAILLSPPASNRG